MPGLVEYLNEILSSIRCTYKFCESQPISFVSYRSVPGASTCLVFGKAYLKCYYMVGAFWHFGLFEFNIDFTSDRSVRLSILNFLSTFSDELGIEVSWLE